MASKTQNRKKRRGQRGRPPDEDCEREPNGRKRRSLRPAKPQEDARMVAIQARLRHSDIPKQWTDRTGRVLEQHETAATEHAGTVLGLLWLQGRITESEKEAGELVVEYHRDMVRATQAPDTLATQGAGTGGDLVSDEYISWAITAVAKWNVAKEWLRGAFAFNVFEYCVLDRNYPSDTEFEGLQRGLWYLAHRMGLDRAKD